MAGMEDCIWHPESAYFLKIYPHMVDLFGGDACCAAVVQIFAFLTNNKMADFYAAGEDEAMLWVRITPQRLAEYTAGLYSWKRIQERVAFLLFHEIILAPAGQSVFTFDPMKPLTFIMNRAKVDGLSKSGAILEYREISAKELRSSPANAGGNHSPTITETTRQPSPKPLAFASGRLSVSGDTYGDTGISESLRKEEEENRRISPLPPSGNFSENHGLQGQELPEDLTEMPSRGRFGRIPKKGRRKSLAFRIQEERSLEAHGTPGGYYTPPPPPPAQPAQNLPPSPPIPARLPTFVLRWNEQMPESARVKYWNGHAPKAELAAAEQDQEFVEQFDEICARCRAMIESGRHVDFTALFEQPKFAKHPGWYLILHHAYPYNDPAPKPGKAETKSKESSRVDDVTNIFRQRRLKREQEQATAKAINDTLADILADPALHAGEN